MNENGEIHREKKLSSYSRWEEAQMAAAEVTKMVTAASPILLHPEYRPTGASQVRAEYWSSNRGLDIWFLNRPGICNVSQVEQLTEAFRTPPQGSCPLLTSVRNLVDAYSGFCRDSHVLLLVLSATPPSDGQTDDIELAFLRKPRNFHMSFVQCNDNPEQMSFLTNLVGKISNFHCQDDYRLESQRPKPKKWDKTPYTYTDYLITSVLATFLPSYVFGDRPFSFLGPSITKLPSLENRYPPPLEWRRNPSILAQLAPPGQPHATPLPKGCDRVGIERILFAEIQRRSLTEQNRFQQQTWLGYSPELISKHASKECTLCHKPFSLLTRRHHCHICGALCCHSCASARATLWPLSSHLHRRCHICSRLYSQLSQLPSLLFIPHPTLLQ